jgi:hypothetical protein
VDGFTCCGLESAGERLEVGLGPLPLPSRTLDLTVKFLKIFERALLVEREPGVLLMMFHIAS